MKRFLSFVFLAWLAGCVPLRPSPTPESVPIGELAQKEAQPRRAASLRLVEQGRIDLFRSLYERAAQQLSKAIEVDSTNPYAYFYLGVTRFRVSRFEEASELFLRAANLFSDLDAWKAEAMAYRGESFEKSGRFPEAKQAFEEALRIDSSNLRAHDGLSRLQEKVW